MKLVPFFILIPICLFDQSELKIPAFLIGDFTDDYGIEYTITDSTWVMHPSFALDIIAVDNDSRYILGIDTSDSTYHKIDYMPFEDMGGYTWGFCYSAYEKKNKTDALSISADRENPRTGCNGFPFSRMRVRE